MLKHLPRIQTSWRVPISYSIGLHFRVVGQNWDSSSCILQNLFYLYRVVEQSCCAWLLISIDVRRFQAEPTLCIHLNRSSRVCRALVRVSCVRKEVPWPALASARPTFYRLSVVAHWWSLMKPSPTLRWNSCFRSYGDTWFYGAEKVWYQFDFTKIELQLSLLRT